MDEWKKSYSTNVFCNADKGFGSALGECKENNIKELKLRILDNEYEIRVENIVDRLLWYGIHIFRMSV